jgi:hypothetical protein
MPSSSERLAILDQLEKGELTPEEAARLLSADQPDKLVEQPMGVLEQLERGEIDSDEAARRLANQTQQQSKGEEQVPPRAKVEVVDADRYSPSRTWGWWVIPITSGALLAVLSGLWMSADARDGSLGFAFLCAWFPMALGILAILFGFYARRGPWASLRVDSRKRTGDRKVNFFMDLPIPIGVAGTVVRTVGRRVPGLDPEDVDKLINAVKDSGNKGEPIHIKADDDDDAVDITIS